MNAPEPKPSAQVVPAVYVSVPRAYGLYGLPMNNTFPSAAVNVRDLHIVTQKYRVLAAPVSQLVRNAFNFATVRSRILWILP